MPEWIAWTEEEMQLQWTWVIWDDLSWKVYRQVPDLESLPWRRVRSMLVDHGSHDIKWEDMPRPGKPGCNYVAEYAAKQREIGERYATPEWPLMTLLDKFSFSR